MGYHRSGFEIVGVDIKPQPRYPFAFIQTDALTLPVEYLREFDVIHASPPCQAYSTMRNKPNANKNHPKLIDETRKRLMDSSVPWVIENVIGSRLQAGILCGLMFGLRVHRHRYFETSPFLLFPPHPATSVPLFTLKGMGINTNTLTHAKRSVQTEAMRVFECTWMKGDEVSQAIPPAYTEWIGKQLMNYLRRKA
ncbi:MAG: DNA cytosine methyltransferase [Pseudomonadota bacterium]